MPVLKEYIFEKRFQIASLVKSQPWQSEQVIKVCRNLKTGRSRDENGMVYELFKPQIAGQDIFNSLTMLFNSIKDQLVFLDFLQLMSITSFYKNKNSRYELSNDHGIFNLPKVRSVLDKLIYKDKYDLIDSHLSCSNVGGRKGRNIS